jgi:2,4-dienoyl-CoA reductase-like NADH-dependent reductase (Old Yellow Enzyme family)
VCRSRNPSYVIGHFFGKRLVPLNQSVSQFDKTPYIVVNQNANLISFDRAFVANPDLPRRLEENVPLNPLDVGTIFGGNEKGYIDYPFLE